MLSWNQPCAVQAQASTPGADLATKHTTDEQNGAGNEGAAQ
jgi:hypothetical protein